MDKATLITKIAAARSLDDKATAALNELPEELLATMVPADAEPTAQPTAAAQEPTEEPTAEPTADPAEGAPTAQPMDWATIMASAPQEVKDRLARLEAAETTERDAYVSALDGKVGLTAAQLKELPLENLKAMASHQQASAPRTAANYMGAAGSGVPTQASDIDADRVEVLKYSPSVFAAQQGIESNDPFSGRAQLG